MPEAEFSRTVCPTIRPSDFSAAFLNSPLRSRSDLAADSTLACSTRFRTTRGISFLKPPSSFGLRSVRPLQPEEDVLSASGRASEAFVSEAFVHKGNPMRGRCPEWGQACRAGVAPDSHETPAPRTEGDRPRDGTPRCRTRTRRSSLVALSPRHLFGCRILWSPGELARIVGCGCFGIAGNTEIRQAPAAIKEEYVGRLDVTVYYSVLRGRQGPRNVNEDRGRSAFGHRDPPSWTGGRPRTSRAWGCPAFADGLLLGLMVNDVVSSLAFQAVERGNERRRRKERAGEARGAAAAPELQVRVRPHG